MHQMKTACAILVTCMSSLAISGCSSEPETPGGMAGSPGTAGTAGTGPVGGSGGSGGGGNAFVQVVAEDKSLSSFTILAGADATPGGAAPAKYAAACTACHQGAGQGFAMLAPEIRHTPSEYATWVIRNGRAGTSMSAFPATMVSDAELMEIVTWSNSLPKSTTPEGLYKDFCGNCHGPAMATGGRVGIKLLPGIAGATVDTAVRNGIGTDPSMRTKYMPKFDTTLLTDQELASIKTYLGAM